MSRFIIQSGSGGDWSDRVTGVRAVCHSNDGSDAKVTVSLMSEGNLSPFRIGHREYAA